MAKRLSETWSIAAIKGEITVGGETVHGAHAVPLRNEKVVVADRAGRLGHVQPLRHARARAEVGRDTDIAQVATSESVLRSFIWVDATPYPATLALDAILLTVEVPTRLPDGRHVVVSFAETESSAGANAYSFEVDQV